MDFTQETLKGEVCNFGTIFCSWVGAGSGTKIHASPLISHLETKKSVNGLTLSLTKAGEASKDAWPMLTV